MLHGMRQVHAAILVCSHCACFIVLPELGRWCHEGACIECCALSVANSSGVVENQVLSSFVTFLVPCLCVAVMHQPGGLLVCNCIDNFPVFAQWLCIDPVDCWFAIALIISVSFLVQSLCIDSVDCRFSIALIISLSFFVPCLSPFPVFPRSLSLLVPCLSAFPVFPRFLSFLVPCLCLEVMHRPGGLLVLIVLIISYILRIV